MTTPKFFKENTIENSKPTVDLVKEKNPYIEDMSIKAVDLPSSGLCYPLNTTITYRLYSFGELKYLSTKVLTEENVLEISSYIDMCLQGIQISSNIDKYELCYYDFTYISLLRKFPSLAKDLSEAYSISSICTHCSTKNLTELTIFDLKFNSLEDVKDLTIVDNSTTLKFKPLTIKRYLETLTLAVENKTINLDMEILFLAACLDNSETILHNYQYIFNITSKAIIKKMFELDTKLNLSLQPQDIECNTCKKFYSIKLDSPNAEYSLVFPRLF